MLGFLSDAVWTITGKGFFIFSFLLLFLFLQLLSF
jgi:hypothetical protein